MQSLSFLTSLIEKSNYITKEVEALKNENFSTLNWKENASSWSILQCIEHLNLYAAYYLPQINAKINRSEKPTSLHFKSGILGSYFSKSILPKDNLNKMKTAKDKNPDHTSLSTDTLEIFLTNQAMLLELLEKAKSKNLSDIKITTSISKLLRLNLGDTFEFYINHELRHLKQIERIKKQQKSL